jgi:putative Mg2+ transporter-C (MgtC) family protein
VRRVIVAALGATSVSWSDSAGRLLLAALLGGLLGLQREYDGQDAGFRTHLLVVLGAALFAVLSVAGFDAYVSDRASTNVAVDVTRIAAYVAPGIGFIGGGAIVKYGGKVSGMTTAASLWCGAAIGVAAGLGLWWAATLTTAVALIALALLEPVSRWVSARGRGRRAGIAVELTPEADLAAVLAAISSAIGTAKTLRVHEAPGEGSVLSAEFHHRPGAAQLEELGRSLLVVRGVRAVQAGTKHDDAS